MAANIDRLIEDFSESAREGLKRVAESPATEHVEHHIVEEGIDKTGDFLTDTLDIDDDGSIADTVPDLISSAIDAIGSIFS